MGRCVLKNIKYVNFLKIAYIMTIIQLLSFKTISMILGNNVYIFNNSENKFLLAYDYRILIYSFFSAILFGILVEIFFYLSVNAIIILDLISLISIYCTQALLIFSNFFGPHSSFYLFISYCLLSGCFGRLIVLLFHQKLLAMMSHFRAYKKITKGL